MYQLGKVFTPSTSCHDHTTTVTLVYHSLRMTTFQHSKQRELAARKHETPSTSPMQLTSVTSVIVNALQLLDSYRTQSRKCWASYVNLNSRLHLHYYFVFAEPAYFSGDHSRLGRVSHPLGTAGVGGRCPSGHPTNSIKALKLYEMEHRICNLEFRPQGAIKTCVT